MRFVCRLLCGCLLLSIFGCGNQLVAQTIDDGERHFEDYYQRTMTWEQKPQPLQYVREADIVWDKLLWRIIDIREKENQYFYYPQPKEGVRGRKNLAYVLWDAIVAYEIPLYEDDEFKIPIENDIIIAKASRSDTTRLEIVDDEGEYEYESVIIPHEFTSDDIYQYALKEVCYIEKGVTGMYLRKIGLAPVQEQYKIFDGEYEYTGSINLFWIPMQSWQVRVLFAKKEAYCEENIVHMPTWEYVFNTNMYSSFITRESNKYNRSIDSYLTGIDALLEAERIETEILNISQDMWEY